MKVPTGPRMVMFSRLVLACGITLTTVSVAQEKASEKTTKGSAPTLEELITALDKDRDGQISKAEANGSYAQRFAQWDANADGVATREEIRAFRRSAGLDDNSQRIAGGAANGAPGAQSRVNAAAAILKEPADWRFEALPVPPGFAPDIKLTGSEEARFAPGMYDTASESYFTYAVAIAADGTAPLGAAELKDFLEKYSRGLSIGVGRRKGFSPDPKQMQAEVTPATAGPDGSNRFTAEVTFFDSFTDGRKIVLHVDAQIFPRPAAKRTYVILLLSPSSKESAIWKTLQEIGHKAAQNLP